MLTNVWEILSGVRPVKNNPTKEFEGDWQKKFLFVLEFANVVYYGDRMGNNPGWSELQNTEWQNCANRTMQNRSENPGRIWAT